MEFISDFIPENMLLLNGIAKQFGTMWFWSKRKSGLFFKKLVEDINKRIGDLDICSSVPILQK